MDCDAIEFEDAAALIGGWAAGGHAGPTGHIVCAANVHMVMEAWDDLRYRAVVNDADLVLPDGQPIVWALRLLGAAQRRRVRVAPDLLLRLFADGERRGWNLGLYGGREESLGVFQDLLARHYPRLRVPCAYAPPFRPLTPSEDEEVTARITEAEVDLLLVGLGCPKQERWMADHRTRLHCVMMGVGAAFDVLGGRTREAPAWTRDVGLEWVFRLAQEPRRLWKRHLMNDPRFLALLAGQVARKHLASLQSPTP